MMGEHLENMASSWMPFDAWTRGQLTVDDAGGILIEGNEWPWAILHMSASAQEIAGTCTHVILRTVLHV